MLYTGLTSVTFRKLKADEIIDLVKKAKLDGIESGGDIHVPHGNIKIAKEVNKMTVENDIKVSSYGSYFIVGENSIQEFEKILETAIALGAPTIRVWAGNEGSDKMNQKKEITLLKIQ